MRETLAPPQPSKKIRWLLVIAFLLLFAGSGWLYFFLTSAGSGASYRLFLPGGAVSRGAGPIPVEVAAASAQDGMAVKYEGMSAEVTQVAFVRKEHYSVKISVTAGTARVEKDSLPYVLLGATGEKLSEGNVSLPSSLNAGQSAEADITDVEIKNARRIVIGK